LILSETDYFHDFESKFYSEHISEKDKKKMLYGLQSKNNKEIDMKKLKTFLAKNKSKFFQPRLREYDNFRKLVYNFMKKKYKYVSYAYGGFEKLHDESIKYNIPLLNHDENCFLCKNKNKKISEVLKEKENKNNISNKLFFFGRKESDSNKNKKKSFDEPCISNSKTMVNDNNNNKNKNNIDELNNKKEGFFSKLFGKNNNKTKSHNVILNPIKNINNKVVVNELKNTENINNKKCETSFESSKSI